MGRLGDGEGKWRLRVNNGHGIALQNHGADGHDERRLTNLSGPLTVSYIGPDTLAQRLAYLPAGSPRGSWLRAHPESERHRSHVTVHAIDDVGARFGPAR